MIYSSEWFDLTEYEKVEYIEMNLKRRTSKTKREIDKLRRKHTAYCEYYHNCDKEINCRDGKFCPVFKHTSTFSSLCESENQEEENND